MTEKKYLVSKISDIREVGQFMSEVSISIL